MSHPEHINVAVIGGGAAGFFAAIRVGEVYPEANVELLESTGKILSKVKVSGGGRCNVTTSAPDMGALIDGYARGARQLKGLFHRFENHDAMAWFEGRGVRLYAQDDGRVFPVSDDSQTIVDILIEEARNYGVQVRMNSKVTSLAQQPSGHWKLTIGGEDRTFDKVIVCTGGSPKRSGLEWLEDMGHKIVDPIPSLFTFNMPNETITELMGLSVPNAEVTVLGTKLRSSGPLLITHWGMSGPAVLKLSAWGARELSSLSYKFKARVRWSADHGEEDIRTALQKMVDDARTKSVGKQIPLGIPRRLWTYLMEKCTVNPESNWGELGKKSINRLVEILMNDTYSVSGKTTFKEEFVTCGGVDLRSVNMKTMESKVAPGIYFAGEILDIDGITGGYNFQAAWTTAYVAGELG